MGQALKNFSALLGRVFLSAIFISAGVMKITGFSHVLSDFTARLQNIVYASTNLTSVLHQALEFALTYAKPLLAIGIAFELVGALLVFLGIKPRFGAFLLVLFLIPTTYMYHNFWEVSGPEREMQMQMFFKNLSIMGGLFLVLAFGTSGGAKSFSAKAKKPGA